MMPQLPGQRCVHCGETILGVTDGKFCRECGCAVHKRCERRPHTDAGECGLCGAPTEVSSELQDRERYESIRRLTESRAVGANADILFGGFFLTCGIALTFAFHWIATQAGFSRYIVTTGLIGIGVYRLVRGIDQLWTSRSKSTGER
jgi:hypothetical protein